MTRASTVIRYLNGENDPVDALDGNREVDDAGGGPVVMDDGNFVTVDYPVTREITAGFYISQYTGSRVSLPLDRPPPFDDNHLLVTPRRRSAAPVHR